MPISRTWSRPGAMVAAMVGGSASSVGVMLSHRRVQDGAGAVLGQ